VIKNNESIQEFRGWGGETMTKQNPTFDSHELYVGIDIGSISINCVVIDDQKQVVYEFPYQRHLGKIEERVLALVRGLYKDMGDEKIRSISFTGNHGRVLSKRLDAYYEFDTITQVLGTLFMRPDVRTIISMGAQDTALFQINHFKETDSGFDNLWELEYFNTNGPCASGTGSFIDQQAERLNTALYSEEIDTSAEKIDSILAGFIKLGTKAQRPAHVACRCTVFTKSDMIHLQNKGEKLEDIILGLHTGNARNYMSTIVGTRVLEDPILFIGGLSLNALQIKAFRDYFPSLIVPPRNTSMGALGVALQALGQGKENRLDLGALKTAGSDRALHIPVAPELKLKKTTFQESGDIRSRPLERGTRVFLGIDIGSTTTKHVLMEEERREIIHKCYVPTRGKPIEVTQRLLQVIREEVGENINIIGTATTGSGRNVVGDFLNADLIIDEITAHARGAVEIDSNVDTIFEIGGQDSKYIYIANTHPLDFDMNKVCAAGTGSFLHELANKYGINIVNEFQEIALSSHTPVKLAERCTVFMESDLLSYHQMGVPQKDLIAGLCYAIAYNYLNRVVGKRKIGQRIMFLGGPSLNKGVVGAFENVLNRQILTPRNREVLGAYGAAVSVQEKMLMEADKNSRFRGLESAIHDRMDYKEKVCHADPQCHNECKLKIYNFDGRKSIWGGECGRYEHADNRKERKTDFFQLREKTWQKHMAGFYGELQNSSLMELDGRPTVGMQRALYGLHGSVLWAHFFDQLGYRLVLTPPTTPHISEKGIEATMAETCYPVKVSHGHVKELMNKTRYLFLPTLIDMATPDISERGYYCPMVQSNSYMVRAALGINAASLLSPVIQLKNEPRALAMEIYMQIKGKLKVNMSLVRKALRYALDRQAQFVEELRNQGRDILENLYDNEPFVVVTGRPYNLYDERLNLRLGKNLSKIGLTSLPMDFIDSSRVDLSDFPSMYWGLGAQILRTAKIVTEMPNGFGLHLTNFGCGADSFLEHFFKYIMGDKAYLILELDEHSAVAGVRTRLEAFKNVLMNSMRRGEKNKSQLLALAN
jgi:predicted CoA-substrate-specific enzyme activase